MVFVFVVVQDVIDEVHASGTKAVQAESHDNLERKSWIQQIFGKEQGSEQKDILHPLLRTGCSYQKLPCGNPCVHMPKHL
jgi:hypothetical protein